MVSSLGLITMLVIVQSHHKNKKDFALFNDEGCLLTFHRSQFTSYNHLGKKIPFGALSWYRLRKDNFVPPGISNESSVQKETLFRSLSLSYFSPFFVECAGRDGVHIIINPRLPWTLIIPALKRGLEKVTACSHRALSFSRNSSAFSPAVVY